MVYRGRVENGVIRLENAPILPEAIVLVVNMFFGNRQQQCPSKGLGYGGGR